MLEENDVRVEQDTVEVNAAAEHAPTRFAVGTQTFPVLPEAERVIADDVAEIVHDLKSPLCAIALEATLLDAKLLQGARVEALQAVARINRNVAFLDRLVLDLLDACSLATGHFELRREPHDLRVLLEDVIDRLIIAAGRASVFLEASGPVILPMDAYRIERVVANLIDNALKYTPASSGIVVRLTRCHAGVCVSVIDSGPGIAGSELADLFERHRRAETARGRAGNGLGLYVCKKIVEAHGGKIGVESSRGVGSRFFFELPIT